jgi:hypothetical protein
MMSFSIRSAICTKIGRVSSIKYSIASSLTWLVTHITNHSAKDDRCQGVFSLYPRLELRRDAELSSALLVFGRRK